MSSEEIISNSTNKSALSGEVRKNGNCANVCEETSHVSVPNDKKESASDCDRKYFSSAPVGIKPVRKDLPNLPPISHQSTKSLNVKDDKNSLSEEDSSENLESLDWFCSGSRDDGMLQNQSQRPKSVSFHTGSSLPVERKISNGTFMIVFQATLALLILEIKPCHKFI